MRGRVIAATLAVSVGLACQSGSAAQQAPPQGSPAQLDGLLAPIALYPDSLLAQMLICAQDPQSVVKLNSWLASNTDLKGTALQDGATVDGFEPSFVAMTVFPNVIAFMAAQLDWTTQVGQAFTANRTAVFDSIQRLRKDAQASGALKTSAQQEVETRTTSSGAQVIVIEPANPQVIYVPQYNPQVVYTTPPPTTVVVEQDNSDAVAAGLIGFTAGIAIGAAIDNDYYYGPWGWGGGVYMYNDAWDDWYDAREDAREDWIDHREDLVEERGERAGDAREARTDRVESRQDTRGTTQTQRTERTETRQENRPATQTATQGTRTTTEARGHSTTAESNRQRSGTGSSDAFSGYSSGRSERAASARGQQSRSSRPTRSGGGGGGRRR